MDRMSDINREKHTNNRSKNSGTDISDLSDLSDLMFNIYVGEDAGENDLSSVAMDRKSRRQTSENSLIETDSNASNDMHLTSPRSPVAPIIDGQDTVLGMPMRSAPTRILSSIFKSASKTPKRIADSLHFTVQERDMKSELITDSTKCDSDKDGLPFLSPSSPNSQESYKTGGFLNIAKKNANKSNTHSKSEQQSNDTMQTNVKNQAGKKVHNESPYAIADVFAIIDAQHRNKMSENLNLHSDDFETDWVDCSTYYDTDPLEFPFQYQSCSSHEKKLFLETFQKNLMKSIRNFNNLSLKDKEMLLSYNTNVFPHILSLLSEQDWTSELTYILFEIIHTILDVNVAEVGSTNLIHFWSLMQILRKKMIIFRKEKMNKQSHKWKQGIPELYLQQLLALLKKFRYALIEAEKKRITLEFTANSVYNIIISVLLSLVEESNYFIPELKYYICRLHDKISDEHVDEILFDYASKSDYGDWNEIFMLFNQKRSHIFEQFYKYYIESKRRYEVRELQFVTCLSQIAPSMVASSETFWENITNCIEGEDPSIEWLDQVITILEYMTPGHFGIVHTTIEYIWNIFNLWCQLFEEQKLKMLRKLVNLVGMVGYSCARNNSQVSIEYARNILKQLKYVKDYKTIVAFLDAISNIIADDKSLKNSIYMNITEFQKSFEYHPHPKVRNAFRSLLNGHG